MIRTMRRVGFGPVLAVLAALVCFGLALLPIHTVKTNLADYAPGGKLEQADGLSYLWTTPDVRLVYRDLPRFAPVFVKLSLLLDRPPGTPPARLEVSERRGNSTVPLTVITPDEPGKSGWQDYLIKLPPSPTTSDELILQLRANGFRVPGDARELGVRLSGATFSMSKSGLVLGVLAQPLLPATLLLLVGLAWWCVLVRFGPLETTLLLAPTGFMAGALANILVYASWWLLVAALLLLATAAAWWRWGRSWLAAEYHWRPLGLLMAGIAALLAFFLPAPGLPGDVFYWREVLAPIIQYGPVGVYPQAPRLVYPPGSVYQLWLYGLVTQPFNIAYNQAPLKLLMGSSLLAIFPLIWWAGARSGVEREHLARTVLLFGFSFSMLFVPAVWIQADGWMWWLMATALLLVIWGRGYSSAAMQALAILYKGQSWLLLPLYALTFQWRFGWRTALLAGSWCIALLATFGGLGFAFDPAVFNAFWKQPPVSGESDWAGIRTFNLLHLLGYDQLKVPQPLLSLSYGSVGLVYGAVMLVCWQRNRAIERETIKGSPERAARCGYEWFMAAALILTVIFFFWVKMHERYLYFGLGFVMLAALYRRDLYRPALLLNALFSLNLLFAYLPERRDPTPHNFFLWRHFLHNDLARNTLCVVGITLCFWLGWLYLRPAHPTAQPELSEPQPETRPLSASI